MAVLSASNQTTIGKNHEQQSVRYDALAALPFDAVTLTTSMATTSVAGIGIPLPSTMKFYGLALVGTGTTIGLTAINVVMGTVAESGIPQVDNEGAGQSPPTPAANGNCLFNLSGAPSDQALTLVQNVPVTIMVSIPYFDAVWPQGAYMTLRVATGATVTAGSQIKAVLLGKVYDPIPWRPSGVLSANSTITFNPPTDIG